MFTGLIEEIGTVRSVTKTSYGLRLEISMVTSPPSQILKSLKIGDSVSVNGVCQTVTRVGHNNFFIDSVAVTMNKTTLGKLKVGEAVNLESSLTLQRPLGGHLVLGHVNGVGKIVEIAFKGDFKGENHLLKVELAGDSGKDLFRYLVAEGSVSIDGVSLTVSDIDDGKGSASFWVSIIPHTWQNTIFRHKKIGQLVNIEVDIVAKYVDKLLAKYFKDSVNGQQPHL